LRVDWTPIPLPAALPLCGFANHHALIREAASGGQPDFIRVASPLLSNPAN
jgi:hypothetical protein